mgnify:CR=1 FL=1
MTKKELLEELEDYQYLLEQDGVDEDEKAMARKQMARVQKELDELESEDEGGKKTPPTKKASATKKAKAPKKEKAAAKPRSKADGTMPSCDELISKWEERRASAKKAAKKAKTRSVFTSITEKVEAAVTKAIKSTSAEEIKKAPAKAIEKFEDLEESMKNFLHDFRKVLGKEYDGDDVEKAVKSIEQMIAGLKKKYQK